MRKETFKQQVINCIKNLPRDASLDEIILKIYILSNEENNAFSVQGEVKNKKYEYADLEDLVNNLGEN